MMRPIALLLPIALAACTPPATSPVPREPASGIARASAGGYFYVLVTGGVVVGRTGSAAALRGIIVPGLASAIACDPAGDLFVANSSFNAVSVYAPGGAKELRTIVGGMDAPQALAFDAAGDAFVANRAGRSVSVIPPGAAKPSRAIVQGVAAPARLAVGPAGSLYVLNGAKHPTVTVYPGGGAVPSRTIAKGLADPAAIAVDSTGLLYVGNLGTVSGGKARSSISVYGDSLQRTIRDGVSMPEALALDASGALYVANATPVSPNSRGWLSVYPRGAVEPARTIQTGGDLPTALAFDAKGNLYVANVSNTNAGSVTIYAPGASKPLRRITSVDQPLALAICP